MEVLYIYQYKRSPLDGQIYVYHTIDGRVYLTPKGGKAKSQLRMPFNIFQKAVKDGYYKKQDELTNQ